MSFNAKKLPLNRKWPKERNMVSFVIAIKILIDNDTTCRSFYRETNNERYISATVVLVEIEKKSIAPLPSDSWG